MYGQFDPQNKNDESADWIFSYADMMTLLLGFFIILFSISNMDEGKFKEMAKEISEALKNDKVRDLKETTKELNIEEKRLQALKMLMTMLNIGENVDETVAKIESVHQAVQDQQTAQEMIQANLSEDQKNFLDEMKGTIDPRSRDVEIILPDTALFASGSNELDEKSKTLLRNVASQLNKIKDLVRIKIVGHTDSRVANVNTLERDNFTLSATRATSVAKELIENGLSPKLMEVSGMGSLQPLFPERSPEGKWLQENMRKNRRVHILLQRRDIAH